MTDTLQLGLPLLSASQAQKHVTVNEALARLDGLVPMVLVSRSLATPPAIVVEGEAYALPAGAVNGWAGHAGEIAIGANGGWVFAVPRAGWRGFLRDEGVAVLHDGSDWVAGAATLAPSGAGMQLLVSEAEVVLAAGTSVTTAALIPEGAIVLGVTARVREAITGSLTGWALGNPGAATRYGSGLGLAAGSWARGVLGQPTAFYAPTALVLSAEGGSFATGRVVLAVHHLALRLPDA